MRVLLASGIDGFCHRYAVLHWAEQLTTQGIAATVRAHGDPRLAADLATHDLLVLYRVPNSPWIAHLRRRAAVLDRATVFAVDDLIVDPALVDPPPARRLDGAGRELWQDGVGRYRRTLLGCDAFLATTPALAALGHALGKPSYVHRCGLAARELALGAAARAAPLPAAAGRPVRLGYFSGTATHEDDFAPLVPVLATLLARHPELELVVAGPLALAPALGGFGARVVRRPLVPWPDLPAAIAATEVSLAPLEWRHPFVAAKGAIKYLEAAAVAVPIVASPTEAFRDATRDGTTGLLAADGTAWETALEHLLGDATLRRGLGVAARRDVEARFAPAVQASALAAILSDVAARGSGAAAERTRSAVAGDVTDEVALARAFPGTVARAAREPAEWPDVPGLAAAATTAPLPDGAALRQRFAARRPGLCRVDVQTITYGLALDHGLALRLERDDGRTIAALELPAALAPDRDWLAFEFAPDPESAGRAYTLELRARGTGPRNALSFATTAAANDVGPFVLDGRDGTGALTLRTFATG